MQFTQKSKEHAIRIMQNISQHPCSKPFLFPLDPISSKCVDYYEKIKRPVNITLIINKLLNAEDAYPYVENWRSDFQLLYKNAITYFGKDSHVGYLAEALLRLFEKKYKHFLITNNSSFWLQRYSSLIQKIKMLEMKMPGSLGNRYHSLYAASANPPQPDLSDLRIDTFTSETGQVEKPQLSIDPTPISIPSQIESPEELKPKKNRPGRPRKIQNQDPTANDTEITDQPTKIKKPRKLRQPKQNTDTSTNNSNVPDISPPTFSFNSIQPIQTNSFPQQLTLKRDDPKPSIFPPSAFSLVSEIPKPSTTETRESPPENRMLSRLPPQLEAKVEDMEDDVLYEVTSCFN